MKELSIEEKAKRFDKALEIARQYWNDRAMPIGTNFKLERMFPELKESDDEKIRGRLINLVKMSNEVGGFALHKWEADEMIAWLEKQGEQKVSVVDFKAKDWYVSKVDGKIYNAKFMEKTPTNQARKLEIEKAAMSATGIIEQEEWFIKGAEWSDKNPSYICSEKQNEQKPTDKVEPKFKVGDWVVCCDYEPEQIIGIRTNVYEMSNGDIRPFYMIDNNHNIRLWTIQDAKDGDVLVHNSILFIFMGIENGIVKGICTELSDTILNFGEPEYDNDYCPATKEQSNLLFSKMHEAGYEWDAEKKELKKIEQRMVSAEAKEAMYSKPVEWSEKDEYNYNTILHHLDLRKEKYKKECNQEEQDRYQGLYDWLKSLRPQNRWKPSEEQMNLLEELVEDNNQRYFYTILRSLYEQLKELKGE